MTNKIFNENCFETLNRFQEKSINCILTSPPYNTARNTQTEKSIKTHQNRYDIHIDNLTDLEYLEWSVQLFNKYDKVLIDNGTVLYNISYSSENTDLIWKFVAEIINKTNFTTADTIIWKKDSALPNNTSHNKLTRICEFVFVFARKSELDTFFMNKQITKQSASGQKYYENKFNFIDAKNNDASNDLNKATFSTDFARNLIKLYTKENDLIYDSFMGTGTTANACVIENRNYIGSELSKEQCEYAEKRLEIIQSQQRLF
jgi:site-specific DNA-methyltransferase (adenine-specific)